MPYINVNDAYILDNTGKQVDDAVDYALANSNRNLLDNPFFTVNQRNFTSSTATNNIYSVDRWYIARGTGTISKTSNGITINGVGASRETTFQQMIDCGDLTGRTVTLSVNDGGTIRQITGVAPARTTSNNIFIRFTLRDGVSAFLYAMATSSAYAYMLQFQVNAGYTLDLRAAKIELGSYSTLANDVPPDYKTELDKCKWYFKRIKSQLTYDPVGYGIQGSSDRAYIKIPGQMRVAPTPSFVGTLRLVGNATASADVTHLTVGGTDAEGIVVLANTAAGSLTSAHTYTMYLGGTTSYIDLSADL